jgi:hypothetical protein
MKLQRGGRKLCSPYITCSGKYSKSWCFDRSPTSGLKIYLGEFLPTFIWDDVTQTVSTDAPRGEPGMWVGGLIYRGIS